MRTAVFVVLILCTAWDAASAQNDRVPVEIDANVDNRLTREELTAFLAVALKTLAAQAGMTTERSEGDFLKYVQAQADRILNAVLSETVDPSGVATMKAVSLEPPLGGTIGDLLPSSAKPPHRDRWTDRLEGLVDIRQSFLDEQGIGKPAKLSLTSTDSDDETVDAGDSRRTWKVQSAVVVVPEAEGAPKPWLRIHPIFAYEISLASEKRAKDLVTHRAGFVSTFLRKRGKSPFSSQYVQATFDWSTDRAYDASIFGFTVEHTPNYRQIGIGQYLGSGALIDLRWRPYVGITYGHVSDAGSVEAYSEMANYAYFFTRLTAEVRLGPRLKITPETTVWGGSRVEPNGDSGSWDRINIISTRLILSESDGSERASIELELKRGRDRPHFEFEQAAEVALAVKF
jgi:hypothetical protein